MHTTKKNKHRKHSIITMINTDTENPEYKLNGYYKISPCNTINNLLQFKKYHCNKKICDIDTKLILNKYDIVSVDDIKDPKNKENKTQVKLTDNTKIIIMSVKDGSKNKKNFKKWIKKILNSKHNKLNKTRKNRKSR